MTDRIGVDMSEVNGVERWLPIEGYENYYEISDQGRVRSLDRYISHYRGGLSLRRGKLLRMSPDTWGHLGVNLCLDGRMHPRLVHHLVAGAFMGPTPEGLIILHGPGGKQDNRVPNLSYGTSGQNQRDKRRDGTDHNLNKDACPLEHLLREPNLVAGEAREGHRSCLACSRGRSIVRSMRVRYGVERDLKTECDRSYALIMGLPGAEPRLRKAPTPDVSKRRRSVTGQFIA